jgi:hypothetical protein
LSIHPGGIDRFTEHLRNPVAFGQNAGTAVTVRYRPDVNVIAYLVADAGGGGLAAQMSLRDYVRGILHSGNADRSDVRRFLETASPRDWLTLDESMRAQLYGGYGEVAAPGGPLGRAWQALTSGGASRAGALAIGIRSMDRDGRIREAAARRLAKEGDPLAGPFLTLRTVDWVEEVAKIAIATLRDRLVSEPSLLIASAPLVFALADRQRRSGLDEIVLERATVDDQVRKTLAEADVRTRRRLMAHEPARVAMTLDELVAVAVADPDTVVASAAGVAAVSRIAEDETALEGLDRLLAGPALVRVAVLGALPGGKHARDLAEQHLFDRSPSVRGAAQKAYTGFGGQPATIYRAALTRSERVSIAVIELAHVGSPQDHPSVLGVLQSPDPAARRAAVHAARWVAGDRLTDLLVPLLWDPSPGVARAAEGRLRGVAKSLDSRMLNDLAAAAESHTRRAAYRLLRRRTAHERLEADLIGLADLDAANQRDALGDLRAWLHRGAASAPRGDLATRRRLSQRLDAVAGQLPGHDVERVRFHAALRPIDLAP